MFIVRHNRLKPPYHDYAALSADALDALASNKVSPEIADLPSSFPSEADVRSAMENAAYFVCSASQRTQMTCRALMQRFGIEKKLNIDENLNEILFTPSKLLIDKDENPLYAARTRLYSTMKAGGDGVEEAASVQTRMDAVAQKYKGENTVLFSHGFLMRLMMAEL